MTIVKISAHTNPEVRRKKKKWRENVTWVAISTHSLVHCQHSLKEDLFTTGGPQLLWWQE